MLIYAKCRWNRKPYLAYLVNAARQMIKFMWRFRKYENITTGGKSILEHGRGEIDHGAGFWSYWMVLLLDFAIAYIALCIYENLPNSILKRNMFIGCDLYLNKVYI